MNQIKKPAGFWVRFGATLLDTILFIALGTLIGFFGIEETSNGLSIVNLVYGIVLPVIWLGYTVGKKALNIKIKRVDGKPVTFGTMLLRNLLAGLIYVFTIGIAVIVSGFMVILRKDKRAIHDFVAGTYVAYDDEDETSYAATLDEHEEVR